jgi:hypothetical protein
MRSAIVGARALEGLRQALAPEVAGLGMRDAGQAGAFGGGAVSLDGQGAPSDQ